MKQQRLVRTVGLSLSGLLLVGCVAGTPRSEPVTAAHPDSGATAPVAEDARPSGSPLDLSPIDAGTTGGTSIDGAETTDPVTKPEIEIWWPDTFVPGLLPEPANGRGNHGGSAACGSCHKPGGSASDYAWSMSGIVFAGISSTTPVASAEIGVKDGERFFRARSASNGYFWLPTGTDSIDWNTAEIRIRTAQGDLKMMSAAGSGDCQTCHTAGNRIYPKP